MTDDILSPAELTEILAEADGITPGELDAAAERLEASIDTDGDSDD